MINKDKKEIQFEQPSDILLLANKYIMFIIAFIVLSILALGYFFILEPKISSIDVTESQSVQTEERRKDNEFLLSRLERLEAEYQDIMNNRQEDLDFLKKMVPEGSQAAEIFLVADRLAKMHDFQLLNIDLSKKQASKNQTDPNGISEEGIETIETVLTDGSIKAMLIKLSVSKVVGRKVSGEEVYNEFKDYLAELESTVRLLDIQSINFSSINAETQEGMSYTFNLDLMTYYR